MNWISERVRNQEVLTGTWLNLGSSLTAEMAANAGFDWVLIDLEHGAGDHPQLVHQLQAVSGTPATPIVRIAWNDPPRFKRVLDLGTCGVMVPYVNNAAEAKQAVASLCYPPRGVRGVAKMNRAAGFGEDFDAYFAKASRPIHFGHPPNPLRRIARCCDRLSGLFGTVDVGNHNAGRSQI